MWPILNAPPVPVAGQVAQEAATWNASVTIWDETATLGMVAYQGLQDVACFIYPEPRVAMVPGFATSRDFTDRILMSVAEPRIRAGLDVEVTMHSGERFWADIVDVSQGTLKGQTTLMVKRRLDRE